MQTNAIPMRYAQQRAFSPKKWLDAKSELFTRLCDEPITRRQALRAHAAFALMGMAFATAEASYLLPLPLLALAAYNVYKYNREARRLKGDGAPEQTLEQKGGTL